MAKILPLISYCLKTPKGKKKKKRSSNRFGSVIQYLEDGPAGNYIILFFCSEKKQKSAVWGMKEAKVWR